MRWPSPISRKVGAALLLAYLCASALVAVELGRRRHDAALQLSAQQARAREMAGTLATLDRELAQAAPIAVGGAALRAPAEQAAAVVQLMRGADSNFGVRWRTLSLGSSPPTAPADAAGGTPAGTAGRSVAAMFAPLPDAPQLEAARLRAEGEYRNLSGLLDMIDSLKQQGTAITELALEGEQVTMSGYVVARAR